MRIRNIDSTAMNELAAQIKRRIDPTDIKNVTVRPVGRTRFEIILPKSGAASGRENLSSEEIEEVKRLISQMGVLEFRILANGTDDLDGIIAARAALDGKSPEAHLERARMGLAPEGPDGEFTVTIGDSSARVRYVWVELGQDYRAKMGLSNANEGQGGLWAEAAKARAAGKTFLLGAGRTTVGARGGVNWCLFRIDCGRSAVNGTCPVASS
jgi:SecD/SecF fusion protein